MKMYELRDLINMKMAERGQGGAEVNCNGGFQKILDIDWCVECNAFHIITEPKTGKVYDEIQREL